MRFLKKFYNKINISISNSKKINNTNILIGSLISKINIFQEEEISKCEFKVFSQFGEDGIIQYLINNLEISNKIFVEFGVENYEECNTRFLLQNNNWQGYVYDANLENIKYIKSQEYYWKYKIEAAQKFITKENINEIFLESKINSKIGLLSIDIDGNDYWVLENINSICPDIIVAEFNPYFGSKNSVTLKYNDKFVRPSKGINKLIYGCSIVALENLCKKKGYELVYISCNGNNAFFVKSELLNAKVKKINLNDTLINFTFKELIDKNNYPRTTTSEDLKTIQSSRLLQKV